jgi:hypothetical protein
MPLILISAAILGGWLVLLVLSGERQRRMTETAPPDAHVPPPSPKPGANVKK